MKTRSDSQTYWAFGLKIRSEVPLSRLPSVTDDEYDLEIRLGQVQHETEPIRVDQERSFWAAENQACHILDGVGAFLVENGNEILVQPEGTAPERLLQLSLLGPAMALALHQRGLFVLHASSVAFEGQGVGFLGGFAAGKSTMAASMHNLGLEVVSDDLTVVSLAGPTPQIVPGYPQVKLWPDAASALGVPIEDLPRVHPDHEKRFLNLSRDFSREPRDLRRLYMLRIGDTVTIESLSAMESFESVLANWYGGRFGSEYLDAIDLRRLIDQAALVTRRVPVRVLTRPATFGEDPDLPACILKEIVKDLADDLDPVHYSESKPDKASDIE